MEINFFLLKIRNRAIFCFFLISIIFPIISITLHRATYSIVISPWIVYASRKNPVSHFEEFPSKWTRNRNSFFAPPKMKLRSNFTLTSLKMKLKLKINLAPPKWNWKSYPIPWKTQSATSRKSKGQIPRSDLTQNPKIKSGPVPPTRIRPRSNPKKCWRQQNPKVKVKRI